jgi:hypothetical protein
MQRLYQTLSSNIVSFLAVIIVSIFLHITVVLHCEGPVITSPSIFRVHSRLHIYPHVGYFACLGVGYKESWCYVSLKGRGIRSKVIQMPIVTTVVVHNGYWTHDDPYPIPLDHCHSLQYLISVIMYKLEWTRQFVSLTHTSHPDQPTQQHNYKYSFEQATSNI